MFKGLHRIIGGGVFAAMGILMMHYMGMWAQRTQVSLEMDTTIFIMSIFIAVAVACAAFWIIFRLLTFWQTREWIRVLSAVIMAVAVSGTHYTGMFAAKYTYDATLNVDTSGLLNAKMAGNVASHGSLMVCYLLCAWGVVVKMSRTEPVDAQQQRVSKMNSVLPA